MFVTPQLSMYWPGAPIELSEGISVSNSPGMSEAKATQEAESVEATKSVGQLTTGARLSTTFTVAWQVSVLPWASLTVNTTVLLPALAQVSVSGKTQVESMPQLSAELSFTRSAVTTAMPEASS